jgi:hypothetical protein
MTEEDEEFNRIEREAAMRKAAVRETVSKRQWVGLTEEECIDSIDEDLEFGLDNGNVSNASMIRYARAIEQLLKGKNT